MERRRASVRRPSPAARVLGASLLGVFTLVIFGAGALVLSTLPGRHGRARVAGLRSAVRIETDARGIPTIRAGTIDDVLFGLGWVHARERLWQMEFQRRVGSGRLAEILGPRLLPTDRFLRTVGFRRAAESAWASLSPAASRSTSNSTSTSNGWGRVCSSGSTPCTPSSRRPLMRIVPTSAPRLASRHRR